MTAEEGSWLPLLPVNAYGESACSSCIMLWHAKQAQRQHSWSRALTELHFWNLDI